MYVAYQSIYGFWAVHNEDSWENVWEMLVIAGLIALMVYAAVYVLAKAVAWIRQGFEG